MGNASTERCIVSENLPRRSASSLLCNCAVLNAQHTRLDQRFTRNEHSGGSDKQRTHYGYSLNQPPSQRDMSKQTSGVDKQDADSGQHAGQAQAEGYNQHQTKADSLERNRAQHHDQCRWTGQKPA